MSGLTKQDMREIGDVALDRIADIAAEQGLTAEKVLQTLVDALDATELKAFNSPVYDDRGQKKGTRLKYSKKLIAWQPRLKAAELGANILRMMPKQRVEHSGTIGHDHKLSPEMQDKLSEVYEQTPGA